MALHTTGSQSTTKLIDVQVARLKFHISQVQSWSNTTTSNYRTDQMANAAKMLDQCRNLLDRLYYYLKPVGGGARKLRFIWLGNMIGRWYGLDRLSRAQHAPGRIWARDHLLPRPLQNAPELGGTVSDKIAVSDSDLPLPLLKQE